MKYLLKLFIPLCVGISMSLGTDAALYVRGNGLVYDSTLNITWLQDANYAQTSGYDADGMMTWSQAQTWVGNLSYGGYNDWRLPSAKLIGNTNSSYNGSTDSGYNNVRTELGHLFLVDLGNKASYNTSGVFQPDSGLQYLEFTDATTLALSSFISLDDYSYWLSEHCDVCGASAWSYNLDSGRQGRTSTNARYYAWAVRDGDVVSVVSVPLPSALVFFISTFLGLCAVRRTRLPL